MEHKLKLTFESGNTNTFTLVVGKEGKKNLNDFILEALQLASWERELPLNIQTVSGREVYPVFKRKYKKGETPIGSIPSSISIGWSK